MIPSPAILHEGPPAIRDAARTYDHALELFHQAWKDLTAAEQHLTAERTKRAAQVREAATKGTALPSTSAITKAEEAVRQAKERRDETERIAIGRSRALARAVGEHAGEWRPMLAQVREAAEDRHTAAAAAYVEAVTALAEAIGIGTWLDRIEQRTNDRTDLGGIPPFPPLEATLDHRNPIPAVEKLAGWVEASCAEPVRPPGGRAEPEQPEAA
jgi:hypothetical protein